MQSERALLSLFINFKIFATGSVGFIENAEKIICNRRDLFFKKDTSSFFKAPEGIVNFMLYLTGNTPLKNAMLQLRKYIKCCIKRPYFEMF